ncbi:molybdopterin molybdotransferase MoeA [Polaribacter tangerinus]|uniref:molybdopterin molybdotransferase MoeA n=1 Tax=Polaribacter tangerinus TaxID=1920034 RepID=UPI001E5568F1|nr:molybdopterin molybdotransferase MoeA [Polaribacter tangerinus]
MMISVDKATQIVISNSQYFGEEVIPFLKSTQRVLKEPITADRDFPPFDRVSMDGIAISYNAFKKGQRAFEIEGIQAAGSTQISMTNSAHCIEVMTGAILPKNTDTVIRYEDISIQNNTATVLIANVNKCQNVHSKGKDGKKHTQLVAPNTIISAAEIGVLATVGKVLVKVAKQPKVMVISTGDELVSVADSPLKHQIRRSNVFTIVSLLERIKIPVETAHIKDDKLLLKEAVKNYLKQYDVLLFSGAVSKGKFDFLPEILEELGVEKKFHRVAQRPGKPFWFGVSDSNKHPNNNNNTVVFGFPGNPVSTFVNCLVYFYPWYYKSLGLELKEETAILAKDVTFKPTLTYFLQVTLTSKFGHLVATPIDGNGSGDLVSLVHANAFIELPANKVEFKSGEVFKIFRYR